MAFKLQGRLGLDGSGFQRGMTRAKAQAKSLRASMGRAFKGMGAAMGAAMGVALITSQVKKTVEWGARIRDLGVQFGVSTAFVQKMDYAFKQTGSDVEAGFKAFRKMNLAASEAREGVEGMTAGAAKLKQGAFLELGLTLEDIKNMAPEEMFRRIGDEVGNMASVGADAQAALNTVFGKAAQDVITAYRNNLGALFDDAEAFLVADEAIAKLGRISDEMAALETQNRMAWADITAGVYTAFTYIADAATVAMSIISDQLINMSEMIEDTATGFADMWKAARAGDVKGMLEIGKNQGKANRDRIVKFGQMSSFGEFGDRMTERKTERGMIASGLAATQEKQKIQQQIKDLTKEREEAEGRIATMEEKGNARAFEKLNATKKFLELMKQANKAQENLTTFKSVSDEEIKAARQKIKDINASTAKEKGDAMVKAQSNLTELMKKRAARKEALDARDEAFAVRNEAQKVALEEKKTKREDAEKAEAEKAAAFGPLSGGAKFGQLARIGGALGGRNPVLDMAKQQLDVQKENLAAAEEIATGVGVLAGTK